MEAPPERNSPPSLPTASLAAAVPDEHDLSDEPQGHDPARASGAAMASANFGEDAPTTDQGGHASGKRAVIQYDYSKAEDNEIELVEGDIVTNIEMVDDDWWMGTNSTGESGLFPSNYVELIEEEEEEEAPAPAARPAPPPAPAAAPAQAEPEPAGATATAIYDYEAAEDNELSFVEDATITGLVSRSQPSSIKYILTVN